MSLTPETRETLKRLKQSDRKDYLLQEVLKAGRELPELKQLNSDNTKEEIITTVETALKNAAGNDSTIDVLAAEADAVDDQPAQAVEAADEDAVRPQASEDAEAIVAAFEAEAADEELCECGEKPQGECEKEACLLEDDPSGAAEAEQPTEAERAINNFVDALNETKPHRRRAGSAGPFNRVLRR